MSPREMIVAHLSKQAHLRPEHYNLAFHYQLSFDVALNHKLLTDAGHNPVLESWDGQFRVKDDDRPLPALLLSADIATNGRNADTGQVSFIGGDIDHEIGHSRGLDDATINRIIDKLSPIKWLQVNRSRGGRGVQFYVFLARTIIADSNSAMYALGAALVQRIADEIEEPDFPSLVDKCGSFMYLYSPHRKPNSFAMISEATELFIEELTPYYPAPRNYELTPTKLDEEHQNFIDWMTANAQKDFGQDGTIYHGHTTDIAAAHKALNLRGEFTTSATGSGDSKFNCFIVPLADSQFLVGNWGNNETWKESERGYRYTILNPLTTLKQFCEERNLENSLAPSEAAEFCQAIGHTFPDPGIELDYIIVKQNAKSIQFTIDCKPSDKVAEPWRKISKMKAAWSLPIKQQTQSRFDPSHIMRVAFSGNKGLSYFRLLHNRHWQQTSSSDLELKLIGYGCDKIEIAKFLTDDRPFEIVNEPFKPELLSKYKWNRGAVQLAFPIGEIGPYDHWQMILNHCGRGLDEAVANDEWCKEHSIKRGADYLKLWHARLFRAPLERLPALSFISLDQNCGKSTYFWSVGMLMTRGGRVLAVKALTTGFESLLLGAVLCDLDDVDLSVKGGEIYQKMQNLLTDNHMIIEGKGQNAIQVRNSTHWGHSANRLECCPVQPGDTRFVIIEVGPLGREIPTTELQRALTSEAPQYLRALFDLPMPPPAGRLYLPVLDTLIKTKLMAMRAGSQLNGPQTAWLDKLTRLADTNKLTALTTFDQLQKLGVDVPTARALTAAWPKLELCLKDSGYIVEHRPYVNGHTPAAWSIRKAA